MITLIIMPLTRSSVSVFLCLSFSGVCPCQSLLQHWRQAVPGGAGAVLLYARPGAGSCTRRDNQITSSPGALFAVAFVFRRTLDDAQRDYIHIR